MKEKCCDHHQSQSPICAGVSTKLVWRRLADVLTLALGETGSASIAMPVVHRMPLAADIREDFDSCSWTPLGPTGQVLAALLRDEIYFLPLNSWSCSTVRCSRCDRTCHFLHGEEPKFDVFQSSEFLREREQRRGRLGCLFELQLALRGQVLSEGV